jgi:hypothetical protein
VLREALAWVDLGKISSSIPTADAAAGGLIDEAEAEDDERERGGVLRPLTTARGGLHRQASSRLSLLGPPSVHTSSQQVASGHGPDLSFPASPVDPPTLQATHVQLVHAAGVTSVAQFRRRGLAAEADAALAQVRKNSVGCMFR